MLPKNTFRDRRLDRLKIFNGSLEELEDPSNVHRLSKERAWLSNVKKVVRDEEQVRQ
jgi:ribosomal protein L13